MRWQAAGLIVRNSASVINGVSLPNQAAGFTVVTPQPGATNLGAFVLDRGKTRSPSAGNYVASSFTLNRGSTLTVSGGIVQIWVTGALVIGGATNKNGTPENLEFLVTSTADVHVNSGASLSGFIYAPSAPITVDAAVNGSIVGSRTALNSDGPVVFDKNSASPTTPPGCASDAQCNDGNSCTTDTCGNGQCQHTQQASCTAVGVGNRFACSLRPDGTVQCWGNNGSGQLGNGTIDSGGSHPNPALVSGVSGATGIAVGGQHVCALVSGGNVMCWGDGTQLTPALVPGISGAIAIKSDGINSVPGPFADPTCRTVTLGPMSHDCALFADGTVSCWGGNYCGQLGDGTQTTRSTPAVVPGLNGVVAIATGDIHTCALLSNGSVKCWGGNWTGQIGDGTNEPRLSPVLVQGLSGATAISAGGLNTCALLVGGSIKCWGADYHGETGLDINPPPPPFGRPSMQLLPVPVQAINNAVAITTGWSGSCALLSDGTAKCWGGNTAGELGNGTTTPDSTPNPVPGAVVGLTSPVSSIAAGGYLDCLVLANSSIACWGDNQLGGAGNGTTTLPYQTVPSLVTF